MPETYDETGREQVTLAITTLIGKNTTAASQVNTDDDDCGKQTNPDTFRLGTVALYAGAYDDETIEMGSGMRFTNITIPQGAVIDEAHLTLRCYTARDGEVVNTRISAEDIDNPGTFIDDIDVFTARWNARTTARVDWDSIPAWESGEDYVSPDIKTVIQEIVRRAGWVSGNSIVLFWEDFEDRSTHLFGRYRSAYSYDGSAEHAPKLVIAYTYAGEQFTIVESLEQTMLAVASETDLATFLETLKPQTVLAVIEKLEQQIMLESREQTVLGVVEESDLMTFLETLKEQVILGVANETDLATFLETLKSQTVLAVVEKLEQLIIVEIREQVALAIAGETDLATFKEKLHEHILLAVQFVILTKIVQRIIAPPSRAYDLGAAPTTHDLGKMQDKYTLGKVK